MLYRIILALLLTVVAVPRASAQAICLSETLLLQGVQRYKQVLTAQGIAADNAGTVQLYENAAQSTWTLVIKVRAGFVCFIAVGTRWEHLRNRAYLRPEVQHDAQ